MPPNSSDIAFISPYTTGLIVKGRCVDKSESKSWKSASNSGNVFSFILKDKTGEIKVTAFNQKCLELYDYVTGALILRILFSHSVKSSSKMSVLLVQYAT